MNAKKIQPIAVEQKVEFYIDGLEILGYIEVIDDRYNIWDTKTMARTHSEDVVRKACS